jgi:hypothetical protein
MPSDLFTLGLVDRLLLIKISLLDMLLVYLDTPYVLVLAVTHSTSQWVTMKGVPTCGNSVTLARTDDFN